MNDASFVEGGHRKKASESMSTFDFSWSIIFAAIVLFLPLCVFYPRESNDMDFDVALPNSIVCSAKEACHNLGWFNEDAP